MDDEIGTEHRETVRRLCEPNVEFTKIELVVWIQATDIGPAERIEDCRRQVRAAKSADRTSALREGVSTHFKRT